MGHDWVMRVDTEVDWDRVGKEVRASREAQGLTQAMLAERTGQTLSTIQNLESARYGKGFTRVPRSLLMVADGLGWPPGKLEALLLGTDSNEEKVAATQRFSEEDLRQAMVSAMVAVADNLTAAEIREISQRTVNELARRGIV